MAPVLGAVAGSRHRSNRGGLDSLTYYLRHDMTMRSVRVTERIVWQGWHYPSAVLSLRCQRAALAPTSACLALTVRPILNR